MIPEMVMHTPFFKDLHPHDYHQLRNQCVQLSFEFGEVVLKAQRKHVLCICTQGCLRLMLKGPHGTHLQVIRSVMNDRCACHRDSDSSMA